MIMRIIICIASIFSTTQMIVYAFTANNSFQTEISIIFAIIFAAIGLASAFGDSLK